MAYDLNISDCGLYDFLKSVNDNITIDKKRVSDRLDELKAMLLEWIDDFEKRKEHGDMSKLMERGSGNGSTGSSAMAGSTRMSIMQRDAWLAQLKAEREEQKRIDEANKMQFFIGAEMQAEDILSAQLELSCELEKKLGAMVCIEMSYDDAAKNADRQQLLVTDDFICNARSLSGRYAELDVPLSYASLCFRRSDLTEKVKNGLSIARLESSICSSDKKIKAVKPFNPRKGIRFRIYIAPKASNESNAKPSDEAADEHSDDKLEEDQSLLTTQIDTGSAVDKDTSAGANVSTDDILFRQSSSDVPDSNLEILGDSGEQEEDAKKKKKKEKPLTTEERRSIIRERKKERNAMRQQQRLELLRSQSSYEYVDDDDEEQELPDPRGSPQLRPTSSQSFPYSDSDDLEHSGKADVDTPTRRKKRRKKKKPKSDDDEKDPIIEEPQEETLGQRRKRKRAEAKARKMEEEMAKLPPVKVKTQQEERPVSRARIRRTIRDKMRGIERSSVAKLERQMSCEFSESGLATISSSQSFKNLDEVLSPNSKGEASAQFKSAFGMDKFPAGPNPRDDDSCSQDSITSLERLNPLDAIEIDVPRSYDGTLRVRLKHLNSAKIIPGYYVIGFYPNSEAQGIVRERDRVHEIEGEVITDMKPHEISQLIDKAPGNHVRLTVLRLMKQPKPVIRPYSGGDIPTKYVTERMVADKEAELASAYQAKKKVKKKVKAWTKEFEKKENRVPTEEDKKSAPEVFKPLDQVTKLHFR